jgi:hypothetical protein
MLPRIHPQVQITSHSSTTVSPSPYLQHPSIPVYPHLVYHLPHISHLTTPSPTAGGHETESGEQGKLQQKGKKPVSVALHLCIVFRVTTTVLSYLLLYNGRGFPPPASRPGMFVCFVLYTHIHTICTAAFLEEKPIMPLKQGGETTRTAWRGEEAKGGRKERIRGMRNICARHLCPDVRPLLLLLFGLAAAAKPSCKAALHGFHALFLCSLLLKSLLLQPLLTVLSDLPL